MNFCEVHSFDEEFGEKREIEKNIEENYYRLIKLKNNNVILVQ
jgi:hypothetical protein